MAGDYRWAQSAYRTVSGQVAFTTGTSGTLSLVPGKTGHQIAIQRVTIVIQTDAPSITLTLRGTDGTYVYALASGGGANTVKTVDWTARGYWLPASAGLELNLSAAGLAGYVVWEAYRTDRVS